MCAKRKYGDDDDDYDNSNGVADGGDASDLMGGGW